MSGDSDSKIAWHRVQLKKNRDALKALETARFSMGEIARAGRTEAKDRRIRAMHRRVREADTAAGRDRFSESHQRELEQLERAHQRQRLNNAKRLCHQMADLKYSSLAPEW